MALFSKATTPSFVPRDTQTLNKDMNLAILASLKGLLHACILKDNFINYICLDFEQKRASKVITDYLRHPPPDIISTQNKILSEKIVE